MDLVWSKDFTGGLLNMIYLKFDWLMSIIPVISFSTPILVWQILLTVLSAHCFSSSNNWTAPHSGSDTDKRWSCPTGIEKFCTAQKFGNRKWLIRGTSMIAWLKLNEGYLTHEQIFFVLKNFNKRLLSFICGLMLVGNAYWILSSY